LRPKPLEKNDMMSQSCCPCSFRCWWVSDSGGVSRTLGEIAEDRWKIIPKNGPNEKRELGTCGRDSLPHSSTPSHKHTPRHLAKVQAYAKLRQARRDHNSRSSTWLRHRQQAYSSSPTASTRSRDQDLPQAPDCSSQYTSKAMSFFARGFGKKKGEPWTDHGGTSRLPCFLSLSRFPLRHPSLQQNTCCVLACCVAGWRWVAAAGV